jgi:hypothetical protein
MSSGRHSRPELPDGVADYWALMTNNRPDLASIRPNHPGANTVIYQHKQTHYERGSGPQTPNPEVAASIPAGGAV